MPDPTGLYPAPPQPGGGISSLGPLQLLDLIDRSQRLSSDIAVGNAFKGAYDPANPSGVNASKLQELIMRNPLAARQLPQVMTGVQQLRSATTQADAFATDLGLKRNAAVMDFIGSISDSVKTKDQLNDAMITHARNNPDIPTSYYTNLYNSAPSDPKKLPVWLKQQQNAAAGSTAAMQRTDVTDPATGQKYQAPLGAANIGMTGPGSAPGFTYSGAPPGTEKSTGAMQDDLIRAGNFGQEMLPLTQALDAANKLKATYGTGYFAPGSKGRQEFQSFFYGISPTIARWLGVDPEKLQDYAKAQKYMTQATATRVGGFGAGTEAQLKTAAGGNPSVDINDMAVHDVLKLMIAARRMEQVQTLQSSQGGPVKYTYNAAQWASTQDPAAYMVDTMSPERRAKLHAELSKDPRALKKFNDSVNAAARFGVMVLPQAIAPAPAAPPASAAPPGMSAAVPGKQSSLESPPVAGARKAKDGRWYLDDPSRPGKYMMVMNA